MWISSSFHSLSTYRYFEIACGRIRLCVWFKTGKQGMFLFAPYTFHSRFLSGVWAGGQRGFLEQGAAEGLRAGVRRGRGRAACSEVPRPGQAPVLAPVTLGWRAAGSLVCAASCVPRCGLWGAVWLQLADCIKPVTL